MRDDDETRVWNDRRPFTGFTFLQKTKRTVSDTRQQDWQGQKVSYIGQELNPETPWMEKNTLSTDMPGLLMITITN